MRIIHLYQLLFCGLSITGWGQLNNMFVYNFSVGDVFQTQSKSYVNNFPVYSYDSILSKFMSFGGDTVFYEVNKKIYILSSIPGGAPIFNNETDTVFYTGLFLFANHYNGPICNSAFSMSNTDTCGVYYETVSAVNSSCFEMEQWTSYLYSGLGGPYYQSFLPSENKSAYHLLVYSKTAQYGACGNKVSYLNLSKNELESLFLSPNVSKTTMSILGLKSNVVFQVIGSDGKFCFQGELTNENSTIDVSTLISGSYYIVLNKQDNFSVKSFVVP